MTENRDFISTDNLKYILGDTEDFEKDVEGFCDRAGEFNYRKFARRLIIDTGTKFYCLPFVSQKIDWNSMVTNKSP